MSNPKYTPEEKTKQKFFSRRHKSREESEAARKANLGKGKVHDYSPKTPSERLAILDTRLGEGVGAKKERARLHASIAAAQ